jgi:probable HAF family extracellular repeat protein
MRKKAVLGFIPRKSSKIRATALAICVLATTYAFAQTKYTIVPVGNLNGTSSASAINNNGQVAGWFGTSNGAHAFLYKNGLMTDLGSLYGAPDSYGFALNNSGNVVGVSDIALQSNEQHAFLYRRGLMTDIGASVGDGSSYAAAINNEDEVAVNLGNHAFLYHKGKVLDLGAFTPTAINDQGQIAGDDDAGNAVVYSRGKLKNLGSLGGLGASAYAINQRGQIAGGSPTATGRGGAFLYSEGKMINLGTTSDSLPLSLAFGLNDNGDVVGEVYNNGLNGAYHAFVYQNGAMFDLNELIINAPAGLKLETALGINDSGEIVANGNFGDGINHAFLLKPTRGNQTRAASRVR